MFNFLRKKKNIDSDGIMFIEDLKFSSDQKAALIAYFVGCHIIAERSKMSKEENDFLNKIHISKWLLDKEVEDKCGKITSDDMIEQFSLAKNKSKDTLLTIMAIFTFLPSGREKKLLLTLDIFNSLGWSKIFTKKVKILAKRKIIELSDEEISSLF